MAFIHSQTQRHMMLKVTSILGNVVGNLASSIVFSKENLQNTTATNATCGIAFCSQDEAENQKLLVKDQLKVLT